LCLVNIKLKCSDQAVKHIRKASELPECKDSPHIKYALALAYRENYNYDKALETYRLVMKNEKTILDYRTMIDKQND